jgi:dolichol-phosphate mannosyltransferase
MNGPLRFSLVVPMFDEQDNVEPLLDELRDVLLPAGPLEVLLIDDGSRDETFARAQRWKQQGRAAWLRLIRLAENRGQSAAICAGFERARADIVAMLDGDRQNDPRDLPSMVARIEAGQADGVSGWRARRQDSFVRRISSRIGNGFRNVVTGDAVADSASGIKVFRKSLVQRLPRFHGLHRFLPTLVRAAGGKVVEVPVHHRPRVAGRPKYGIGNRLWRGIKDCLAVRWLRRRIVVYTVQEER